MDWLKESENPVKLGRLSRLAALETVVVWDWSRAEMLAVCGACRESQLVMELSVSDPGDAARLEITRSV